MGTPYVAGGPVPARSSLAPKDPEERRRRILAAAVDVLTEKGFAGTRIADVAAAAGTSPALVVYHFGTLDGALAEALGSVEDAFYAELAAGADPDAGAVERLRALGALACETGPAIGSWALWMEVWVRALHDGQARALSRALDARWKQTLRSVVDDGLWEGVFACPDPGATVNRLASLMDGLAVQVALRDPEISAARMTELWLTAAALELGVPATDLLPPASTGRRRKR
ncbi:MAG TPA: TetR/AcrR family transcriptional regulator [Candidatus Nanopelagicales bacterium]|nr:TetR/AcrR family transcriptional regulator [Candidatus Nanopelagicales bacterium]